VSEERPAERFPMSDPRRQTEADRAYAAGMNAYFGRSRGTPLDKLRHFAKFVPRQALAAFLAKADLFRRVVGIHGHVIECGVFLGGGLMTWANASAIFEPMNHTRRIVGFDTFGGFADLAPEDHGDAPSYARPGGLAADVQEDLATCLSLYDGNRPLGHIPRVELVPGDATRTIPAYLADHPHLVVALLYLDFDLYAPTKAALETFRPRMPKGAVLAFDELNQEAWPGETLAVLETVGLQHLKIERVPHVPQLSFAVLE
jgi:hypothetical protein